MFMQTLKCFHGPESYFNAHVLLNVLECFWMILTVLELQLMFLNVLKTDCHFFNAAIFCHISWLYTKLYKCINDFTC